MLRLHSCLSLRRACFHYQCYYQSSSSGLPTQSCFDLFCCDVRLPVSLSLAQPLSLYISLCLSLSNLVATYTSELYLPIAQCQVSHQGLYVKILLGGYELFQA